MRIMWSQSAWQRPSMVFDTDTHRQGAQRCCRERLGRSARLLRPAKLQR